MDRVNLKLSSTGDRSVFPMPQNPSTAPVKIHTVRIHNRQTGTTHELQVPSDRYILHCVENQGVDLPFSCRNGACTACAVRVQSGDLRQPEAMGLSPELQSMGYALLCVSYAQSDLEVETQDEDEVYVLQFGRNFGRGKVRFGLPLEDD
jgi:ferredoxin